MNAIKRLKCATAGVLLMVWTPALAESPDYDTIADNLVNQSLAVQPGEIVVISGTPTELELMESIFVAASKAGGDAIVTLNLPEANKRAIMETPVEHLGQLPTSNLWFAKMADVFINVGSIEDPDLFADVPEDRLATARQAGTPLMQTFKNSRSRGATLGQTGGIPTAAYAESVGADPDEVTSIFWQAVSVSPDELTQQSQVLASLMANNAEVQVTSSAGTDLKFKLGAMPARINAGRTADVAAPRGATNVWLPAGEAYNTVDSATATGTVVVPSMTFRGVAIENLKVNFKNGQMTKFSAKSGEEMLENFFDAASPKLKQLSVLDIGINPHSKSPSGSTYYSWEMGGMVTLGMGNNIWAGGDNDSDAALGFHLPDTTVAINGKTVVDEGELVK